MKWAGVTTQAYPGKLQARSVSGCQASNMLDEGSMWHSATPQLRLSSTPMTAEACPGDGTGSVLDFQSSPLRVRIRRTRRSPAASARLFLPKTPSFLILQHLRCLPEGSQQSRPRHRKREKCFG